MIKKFKKAVLMTTLIASLVTFVGCSSDKKETAKKQDKIVVTVQAEKDWMPYYEQVEKTVESKFENADIQLIEIGCFDHLDVIDKTDISNKDVADVFALPADRFYGLADKEVLAKIDAKEMAKRVGGFKNFDEGLGGNLSIDGTYLAFPYNIETLIAYVNVKNAEEAGIDLNKDIEFTDLDFEEMLVLAHDCWFGVAFANSANLELLSKDENGKLTTDLTKEYSELTKEQQELFTALYNYWKEHNDNVTNLWDKDAAGGYLDAKFSTGEGNAIRIDGPWAAPDLTERVGSADNLKILPLNQITVNNKQLKHWKGGWGLGINARVEEDADKMEVACAVIEEIVNPKNAAELFKYTGKLLENVEPSAYDSLDEMNKMVINATYKSYKTSLTRPLFTEFGSVWGSWQNACLSWSATNPKTPEEAYNQVKASFEAMMSTF
ncbi:MAG: hypothetical protein N4A63_15450 [Vallitalea sp.]|jgi:arabinogalactan oligomer/maltooligosaccharide transport system substrate-binding protein|nr:hypothetical protein [Vallitalea sp.]